MIYFGIASLLTLFVLIVGILLMAQGGKLNGQLSNKLMAYRVFFQAVAIIILAIVAYLGKSQS